MHQLKFILAAALTVMAMTWRHVSAQYPAQIRIMTYNINAETHTDGDYTDIGNVINEIDPTIAGLQKVDSCTVTTKPVDVLKALGEQENRAWVFHNQGTIWSRESGPKFPGRQISRELAGWIP